MDLDLNILTSKQKKVLTVIEAFIKTKGIPPTVREIGEMVGEKTPGAVQGILNRLEKKGVLTREVGMARSIRLVNQNSNYVEPVYLPEIKKISVRNIDNLFNIYNIIQYLPIPQKAFKGIDGECFALKCPDNSLMESGISYEDMLIVHRTAEPENGDIVIVMYENHVLLRRYYINEGSTLINLKADSDLLSKDTFDKDEICIVGKLIGKITAY